MKSPIIEGIHWIEDINKAVLSLSPQEREVFDLSFAGYSNRKMGKALGVSSRQAKKQFKAVKELLDNHLKRLELLREEREEEEKIEKEKNRNDFSSESMM